MVRRREILTTAIALAAGQLAGADLADAAAPPEPKAPQPAGPQPAAASGSGPAKPFDYAWLKGQARYLAGSAYQTSKDVLPPSMAAFMSAISISRYDFAAITRSGAMRGCPSACNFSMLGAALPKPCISMK